MTVIRATFSWLASPRNLWACTLVLMAASTWIFSLGATESAIRLTGLILQILGVLTVARGLSETRAFFGRPPVASKIISWLKGAPFLRKSSNVRAVGVGMLALVGKARAYSKENPSTQSIGDRLSALEVNIDHVHSRISGLETEYDSELRKVSETIKAEASDRAKEVALVNRRLEQFGTGGISLSAVGVAWLFVGLIFSTASVELSRMLSDA